MNKLKITFQILAITECMCCSVLGGNIDSPGVPAQGSGMYSLQNLYDYLLTGNSLTVQSSFQVPYSAPVSTMVDLRKVGDDIRSLFSQCDALPFDVSIGKKFFCTESGMWGVQTGTATTIDKGLLKTGQTQVFRSGDDGTYQKGANFNYLDNGDGTVTDRVTGLMWAKDGNGGGCANGATISWSSAIDWANNLVFAGYSDWRVPNIRELDSISNFWYQPALDVAFFPNTYLWPYWSSTTHAAYNDWAQINNFVMGYIYREPKTRTDIVYVRAVRGGT